MRWWLKTAGLCLLAIAVYANGSTDITKLDGLPPGEQYRQLSLILLISGGADAELMDALTPADAALEEGGAAERLSPDDYKTPLIRIVDQETMLSGAAFLLRFAKESNDLEEMPL